MQCGGPGVQHLAKTVVSMVSYASVTLMGHHNAKEVQQHKGAGGGAARVCLAACQTIGFKSDARRGLSMLGHFCQHCSAQQPHQGVGIIMARGVHGRQVHALRRKQVQQ